MCTVLTEKIKGPSAWLAEDFKNDNSWIHQLSDDAIETLDSALRVAIASGRDLEQLTKKDFPLGEFAVVLNGIAEELENGRGFLLLRGLPVDRYSESEIGIIYYGLGLHLGTPVRQNYNGDLLGVVMNVGDLNNAQTRVYETNAYLPYHTDPSDVVGLLCLRKAQSGGLSSLVSVASVYNEIIENHPEYLALYYRQFFSAHLGTKEPTPTPIFSYHAGKLACRFLRQYLELGQQMMQQPLSSVEVEALNIFDAIAHDPKMRITMMMEPGDLQLANNYAILHSRTEFQDFEDEARRRKKLRLWLKMPNARTLAPDFPGRNGFPESKL